MGEKLKWNLQFLHYILKMSKKSKEIAIENNKIMETATIKSVTHCPNCGS